MEGPGKTLKSLSEEERGPFVSGPGTGRYTAPRSSSPPPAARLGLETGLVAAELVFGEWLPVLSSSNGAKKGR